MTDQERPIATPYAQKVADFKRRRLPVVVWSAAALVCVWILADRARNYDYVGLAQSLQYEISASTVGRIDTLTVDVFDEVEAGDVVAKLDDQLVQASIDTADTTVRQLDAQLEAARQEMLTSNRQGRASWTADLRRFQIDEEQRSLEGLKLGVTIESDEVEQERLKIELRRARAVLDAGLMGQMEFDNIRLQHDLVVKRLEDNKVLLAQTDEQYRAARARREEFQARLPQASGEEPVLQPLREAIAVQTKRLQEIQLQRGGLILRSPVAGQVSQILCRKGQSVVPGEPILTIAERSAREVVAYIAEGDSRQVSANARVLLSSATRPQTVAESFVLRVGTSYDVLPQRLWASPAAPAYGRAVIVSAVPELRLLPGERVDITFLDR